jgi:hypothetical protein
MRARVLVTNRSVTADLFWVIHKGTGVYFGQNNSLEKTSYHQSGRIHTKTAPTSQTTWSHQHHRLPELKDVFPLITLTLPRNLLDGQNLDPWYLFTGKKTDAAITLDLRFIPIGFRANVIIGLVEPGRLGDLDFATSVQAVEAGVQFHQLIIATSVKPWVFARPYG